ncbi:MAG TPA: response regulator [Puia sp.]|nr:response regulator [Puia sp.]
MPLLSSYLMVADDDADDRLLFGAEFELLNPDISVKYAGSGSELLDYLAHCPTAGLPAVILLDYKMHDVSGPEVLQILMADRRYAEIVVVVWSTSQRAEDMEKCKRLGAVEYLVKPGTNDDLDQIVRRLATFFSE